MGNSISHIPSLTATRVILMQQVQLAEGFTCVLKSIACSEVALTMGLFQNRMSSAWLMRFSCPWLTRISLGRQNWLKDSLITVSLELYCSQSYFYLNFLLFFKFPPYPSVNSYSNPVLSQPPPFLSLVFPLVDLLYIHTFLISEP